MKLSDWLQVGGIVMSTIIGLLAIVVSWRQERDQGAQHHDLMHRLDPLKELDQLDKVVQEIKLVQEIKDVLHQIWEQLLRLVARFGPPEERAYSEKVSSHASREESRRPTPPKSSPAKGQDGDPRQTRNVDRGRRRPSPSRPQVGLVLPQDDRARTNGSQPGPIRRAPDNLARDSAHQPGRPRPDRDGEDNRVITPPGRDG